MSMNKVKIIGFAAVVLVAFSCKKSAAPPPANKDIWTSYPTNGTFIWSIAIDAQGNKWFASAGSGLLKFDGANWTTYDTSNSGLADNYPSVIAIDARGNKWIGSSGSGVSKFDGANWSIYDTTNSGLADNNIFGIATDAQNNIWFATLGGISKFDGANWTN